MKFRLENNGQTDMQEHGGYTETLKPNQCMPRLTWTSLIQ